MVSSGVGRCWMEQAACWMEHLRLGKRWGGHTRPVRAESQGMAGCRKTLSSFRMELSADPSREWKGKGSWQVCVCVCLCVGLDLFLWLESLTPSHIFRSHGLFVLKLWSRYSAKAEKQAVDIIYSKQWKQTMQCWAYLISELVRLCIFALPVLIFVSLCLFWTVDRCGSFFHILTLFICLTIHISFLFIPPGL